MRCQRAVHNARLAAQIIARSVNDKQERAAARLLDIKFQPVRRQKLHGERLLASESAKMVS